jgi:hypothetical protein
VQAHSGIALTAVAVDDEWLRNAQRARRLASLSLAWLCFEGAATTTAGLLAGSIALIGNGLDGAIEGLASMIVVWRFSGSRTLSTTSERRAQQLVALSFFLLAPYIALEATRALLGEHHAETTLARGRSLDWDALCVPLARPPEGAPRRPARLPSHLRRGTPEPHLRLPSRRCPGRPARQHPSRHLVARPHRRAGHRHSRGHRGAPGMARQQHLRMRQLRTTNTRGESASPRTPRDDRIRRQSGSPLRLGVTRAVQGGDSPAISRVLADSSDVEGWTQLERLLPCPFRRPSMAGGRRPLAATPLHHKHGETSAREDDWKPAAQADKPGARTHAAIGPLAGCPGPRCHALATTASLWGDGPRSQGRDSPPNDEECRQSTAAHTMGRSDPEAIHKPQRPRQDPSSVVARKPTSPSSTAVTRADRTSTSNHAALLLRREAGGLGLRLGLPG